MAHVLAPINIIPERARMHARAWHACEAGRGGRRCLAPCRGGFSQGGQLLLSCRTLARDASRKVSSDDPGDLPSSPTRCPEVAQKLPGEPNFGAQFRRTWAMLIRFGPIKCPIQPYLPVVDGHLAQFGRNWWFNPNTFRTIYLDWSHFGRFWPKHCPNRRN